jgi:hypothetical protein
MFKKMIRLTINKEKNDNIIKELKKEKILIDFPRTFNYPTILGFKDNQLLNLSLYYMDVFQSHLETKVFDLFKKLQNILIIVLSKFLKKDDVNELENKIFIFLYNFKKIFGKINCTANFHNMLHIPYCVKFVNLIFINCFNFERYNGILSKNFWGSFNVRFFFKFIFLFYYFLDGIYFVFNFSKLKIN